VRLLHVGHGDPDVVAAAQPRYAHESSSAEPSRPSMYPIKRLEGQQSAERWRHPVEMYASSG
jgi:hypothetical protein